MSTSVVMRRTVLLAALGLLLAWLPAASTQATELSPGRGGGIPEFMGAQSSSDDSAPPSARGFGELAAGAVEDPLEACLARIPTDASAGQRMLAEQGCEQEAGIRKMIQTAPKF